MTERYDEAIDELRELANELRTRAQEVCYGYAPAGADPRDFSPDLECCSDDEVAAHKSACEAWERGERPQTPSSHEPLIDDDGKPIGHVTRAFFGIGTYTYIDELFSNLSDRVERILNRLENP